MRISNVSIKGNSSRPCGTDAGSSPSRRPMGEWPIGRRLGDEPASVPQGLDELPLMETLEILMLQCVVRPRERSEERRVGKERRSGRNREEYKKRGNYT